MTKYHFRLFVNGHTLRAAKAVNDIQSLCNKRGEEDVELEIIDVLEQPQLAEDYHIIAAPTLVRVSPEPSVRIIGEMKDINLFTMGLDGDKQSEKDRSDTNGE